MTTTEQGARFDPDGEMTIYHAAQMKQSILDLLDCPAPGEVNLSRVTELDGAGLQLLIMAKREAAARGHALGFTGHSPAVLEVLDLTNLAGLFGDPVVLSAGQ
jgi:anti-anti-sigma factor